MTWITHTQLESYMGKSFSAGQQVELDRLSSVVQKRFEQMTNRTYPDTDSTAITEYFDPNGENMFWLKNTPIKTITSVKTRDLTDGLYYDYSYENYIVDGNRVVLETGLTSGIPNYLEIIYTAEIAPADVIQALVEWVMLIWNSKYQDGQTKTGEGQGTHRVDFMQVDNLPANIKLVIDTYKVYNT